MLVSVIVPTLDERANLAARASDLAEQTGPWEWIVSDGGSSDGTPDAARQLGARVISVARGRGKQLDAGARAARGEILVFLHADTVLPTGAFDRIRAALRAGAVGGNFALRFDENTLAARVFALIYDVRQRAFGTFFGDSVIFAQRTAFERVGGFGELPIMEDYAFVVKLRAFGHLVRLQPAVVTSSRRYRGRAWRTLWRWFSIMTLYRLGVPPTRLASWYAPHAPQQQPTLR